jgi:hypothetical protein
VKSAHRNNACGPYSAVATATRYHSNIHLVHVIEPTADEFLAPEAMSQAYEKLHHAAEEPPNRATFIVYPPIR